MSNKFTRKLRRVFIFFNPYYSKEGYFEFSRLVAVSIFFMIALAVYAFKNTLNEYRNFVTPYNLVADFYYYIMYVPVSTLPTVLQWIKDQPELTTNADINKAVVYGGIFAYTFIGLSLYMMVYGWVQRLTKSPFRIGDFLGFYVVPLFLGFFWYFCLFCFYWLSNLR